MEKIKVIKKDTVVNAENPLFKVQSVLFDRSIYTPEEAIKWLFANRFEVKKLDGTKSLWRFRQHSPATLRKEGFTHYAHKKISDGISFVIVYKA